MDCLHASGPPSGLDSLPLFPNRRGKGVAASAMLILIELLATMIGLCVVNSEGRKRFGKHSWRSTGAVWLSLIGLDIMKIKLLARWDSEIITHYARLAPLSSIADDTKDAMRKKDSAKTGSKKRAAPISADRKHITKAIEEQAAAWGEELRRLENMIKDREVASRPARYVRNLKTKIVHRIAGSFDTMGMQAITFCHWPYIRARTQMLTSPPTSRSECCGTCMPALRASLD